jgi:hypothetical protein
MPFTSILQAIQLFISIAELLYLQTSPLFMSDYKFDRTVFKMKTFKEADQDNIFDKSVSYSERLRQAYYLISQAYGFLMSDPPRLDKSCFSSRRINS